MRSEKKLFGKIVMIPAVIYLLLDGINRLPAPFVAFSQFKELIASDESYAIRLSSSCFLGYFEFAVLLIWLICYWKDREHIRIPAILTMLYLIFSFGNQIMNDRMFHTYDSFFDAVRYNWVRIPPIVIWAVLVIGTELPYRIVFAVLRGIMLLVQIRMDSEIFKTHIGGMINVGNVSSKAYNIYGILYFILFCIVRILFILYLVYPRLFHRSDGSGQFRGEAGR